LARAPGRHWLVILGCLGIACLPERLQASLRHALLELTARTGGHADEEDRDPTPRERALSNELRLAIARCADQERALAELKAAAEITAERSDLKLIPVEAFPLAGPGEPVRRVVLSRGAREGVAHGQPVLAGHALVGLVLEASRERAEVRLVTDFNFHMRARAPRAGIEGRLHGTGDALVFVPACSGEDDPGAALKAGDTIVVSRSSTLVSVPAVLGVVRSVERSSGDACSRAIVVPAAPIGQLTRAVVLRAEEELARALPEEPR